MDDLSLLLKIFSEKKIKIKLMTLDGNFEGKVINLFKDPILALEKNEGGIILLFINRITGIEFDDIHKISVGFKSERV